MISLTPSRFLGGLFIVGLALAAANVAVSQVATISGKGKFKTTKEFFSNAAGGNTNQVYTVPDNRTLIVTDVVIANLSSSNVINQKVIRDGASATALTFSVPAESTVSHSFTHGIAFPPGSLLEVRNGGGGGTASAFFITGYEIK